jgi:hypothetical protein
MITRKKVSWAFVTVAATHFAVTLYFFFSLFLSQLLLPMGRDYTDADRQSARVLMVLTFPTRNLANALAAQPDAWRGEFYGWFVMGGASMLWAGTLTGPLLIVARRQKAV